MSSSEHSSHNSNNQKTNFLLRIVLAFVFALAVGFLLRVIIGNQKCSEMKECKMEEATLWGKKECCKKEEGKSCCQHDEKNSTEKSSTQEEK
jgi:uncharacterized membrane protein YraQ (UPF0718 family)